MVEVEIEAILENILREDLLTEDQLRKKQEKILNKKLKELIIDPN